MKKLISVFLAAVMTASVMTVPAFADVVKEYGVSVTFGEPVGIGVTSKDKWGYTSYIKNNDYKNVSVKPLSEAPEMKNTKTIEGVTFSNYMHHAERNSKDAAGNPIKINYVYIGLNGAMRSDKGSVEFMTIPSAPFNYQNPCVRGVSGSLIHPCSDLNTYKTNTAYLASDRLFDGKNGLTYLYDIGITPYTNGERNMDGTWNEGLTWVFGWNDSMGKKTNGTYAAVYPIRVNQGDSAIYFAVAVVSSLDDVYVYRGEQTQSQPVKPVEKKETAAAKPTSSKVYVNGKPVAFDAYNINGNNYFKLRDVAYAINGTRCQFEVGWDAANKAISLTMDKPYTGAGGTVSASRQQKTATKSNSPVYVDGGQWDFTAYEIGGNNYFKLRDLGARFDFYIGWDNATQSIVIDTTRAY